MCSRQWGRGLLLLYPFSLSGLQAPFWSVLEETKGRPPFGPSTFLGGICVVCFFWHSARCTGPARCQGRGKRRCPGVALPSRMSPWWALESPTWELRAVRPVLCAHPEVIDLWVQFGDYCQSSQHSESPAHGDCDILWPVPVIFVPGEHVSHVPGLYIRSLIGPEVIVIESVPAFLCPEFCTGGHFCVYVLYRYKSCS